MASDRPHPLHHDRRRTDDHHNDHHPHPPDSPGVPLTRAQEDAAVKAVLRIAAEPGPGIERAGQPAIEAYEALARSRGVDLERVVRAELRGELADIVRLPVATG